jgi:hypothetical protein
VFSKKVGSLYDYPEYVKSGINISARSYNVADIQITSQKNDIMISGTLGDKTKNGIVWLYIFGKPAPVQEDEPESTQQPVAETVSIPSWIKNNARWWAAGEIGDSDFVQGIKFLIESNIMTIPQTAQGTAKPQEIPYWIKNNARWWSEGAISDLDFVLGIQYLIKNGIMHVGQVQNQTPSVVEESESSEKLGAIKVSDETVERQGYQSTTVQIIGTVNDFKTGTYVILTIIRPDQSSYDVKGLLTSKGQFTVPLMIDSNSLSGRYAILGKYNGDEFGITSFVVN